MDDKDLSSHVATQSELRASAAEFPFGLRSPAALRVSPGLLLSSFGAVLLLSLSCVALCVLIFPGPSLRCCASFLLRRRPSFAVRGSGGGVCRRRPAARNSPPGPPSRPVAVAIGPQWILLFLLLIGISKAVVLLGLRLRSPPVASGRLRSPPVASGHLRSTSLAKHKRDGPGVGSGGAWVGLGGRGALFQCTNAFWGLKNRSQGG